MSFFLKGNGAKRRGGKLGTRPQLKKKKIVKRAQTVPSKPDFDNEEIESDSDVISDEGNKRRDDNLSSEEEEETVQEKKLRLAKEYLARVEEQETDKQYDDDIRKDAISHRLQQDMLEKSGKLQTKVADTYETAQDDLIVLKGHNLSVTCVAISSDNKYVYSGSKDCSIIKWSIPDRRKVKVIHGGRKGTEKKHIGHTAQILCIAISTDSKYLATGDLNKLIYIWNPDTLELLHTFKGHRDAVSGLVFRRESHQLFSCSYDRSVKIWDVDENAYIETLFGHQDKITGIDGLMREKVVTSGGRDNSVRVWKIIEESQLVFNGHSCSIDCIALINETSFISGSDDNCLCLWNTMKKKPVYTLRNAHTGNQGNQEGTPVVSGNQENWITSVAALVNTDLVASGSKDGCIRLWKCANDCRTLKPVCTIPLVGFVNSLQFSRDGSLLVAGVGQEHRMGRWWRLKEAKNSICIVPLKTIAS